MNSLKKEQFKSKFITTYGRAYYNEVKQTLGLSFSFTGFKVTFEGTSLSGTFISTMFDNETECPYIAIYVDVDYVNIKTLLNTKMVKCASNMDLVSGLPNGRHTVIVRKLSEVNGHPLFLKELTTDGEFVENTPEQKRLSIEFYGDSLTASLGMLGSLQNPSFSSWEENVALGYAARTASTLNADLSIMALSGYPMAISPYVEKSKIKRVPQVFSLADFDGDHTENELPKWDNASHQPDLVVINLGANDRNNYNTYPEQKEMTIKAYEERYDEFIKLIEKTYPNAKIVMLAFGLYYRGGVGDAFDRVYAKQDHSKVYRCYISLKGRPSYGTCYHPTVSCNERYAEGLIKFLKENVL